MKRTNSNPATSSIVRLTANYCGVEVEVISQMDHCSLIRYGNLTVVVDTVDVVFAKAMKTAA